MKQKFTIILSLITIILIYCGKSTYKLEYNSDILINQDTLASMDQMLNYGIQDTAYPGFVFIAGKKGEIFYYGNGGNFRYDPDSPKMEKGTIFDLASLTKVISTTSAAMLLYDAGKLDLNTKVADVLPEFAKNGKENITFYHLLTHSSGIPAHIKLYKLADTPQEMINVIYNLKQDQKEGEKIVYSCLGYIILGKAIEKISGQTLDKFVYDNIFKPLGMNHTFYNPPEKYKDQIAPTEYDEKRGGILQGLVHDENAFYLGGISGNAGLFSTAENLAIFAQMMLNKGTYDGKSIFQAKTVDLFTKAQNIKGDKNRSLGWSKASGTNSAGQYFSKSSFGHTGYTGTAIWIDPSKDLFGIFLSNRVHPTRENQNIYDIRDKIFNKLQYTVKFNLWLFLKNLVK